jgi:hypothetical protein
MRNPLRRRDPEPIWDIATPWTPTPIPDADLVRCVQGFFHGPYLAQEGDRLSRRNEIVRQYPAYFAELVETPDVS